MNTLTAPTTATSRLEEDEEQQKQERKQQAPHTHETSDSPPPTQESRAASHTATTTAPVTEQQSSQEDLLEEQDLEWASPTPPSPPSQQEQDSEPEQDLESIDEISPPLAPISPLPPDDPASQPVPDDELPDPRKLYPVTLKEGQLSGDQLQQRLERGLIRSDLENYWGTVLTGSIHTIPDKVRRAAQAVSNKLSPEESEERLLRTVNQSWAADHLGISRSEIHENWAEIRDKLSKGRLIAADEEELFYSLSDEQEKYQYQELSYDLFEKGYQQGLISGDSSAWRKQVEQQKSKMHPSKHAIIDRYAQSAYEKGVEQRKKLLPIALTLSEGIEMMVSAEQRIFSPEQVVDSAGSAQRAASQLRRLNKQERELVYHLCLQERRKKQASANQGDEGLPSRAWRSAKRGATNVGYDLGLGLMHLGSATLHTLGDHLDESWGTDLQETAEDVDLRARVAHEIRNFAQQQVAPLYIPEDTSLGEQFMIDMAGVVPSAAMGFGGALSWGSLITSGIGSSVSAARERNPDGDIAMQNAAGLIGAGIQEGISFGFTKVGGRVFEKSLSQFMKAKGQGVGGYTLAALRTGGIASAETVKMALEQKAGQLTDLGLHELSSRIDQTNSNIDWESYGSNLTDIETNMREAALTLPYLLIGAGRAKLHHFEQARELKNNSLFMDGWGLSEEQIDSITQEQDLTRANEKLRDAMQQSPLWGGVPFLKRAVQSLKLLNADYFTGFKDEEVVRDFLQLPAEIESLPHTHEPHEPIKTREHLEAIKEKHGIPPSAKVAKSLGRAMEVWDYLWRRANLDRLLPPSMKNDSYPVRMNYIYEALRQRHQRNIKENKSGQPIVPLHLNRGFYSPQAEQQRRAMLRDRAAEIHDISYIYLLTTSPPDYTQRHLQGADTTIKKREMKRQRFLDRIATEVMHRLQGRSRRESELALRTDIGEIYRHFRTEPFTASWIKPLSRSHFREMHEHALYTEGQRERSKLPPEFFQACETLVGAEQSVQFLYEMLPQLDDFHRLLGRGKTPDQAYATLLQRELGLTGKTFKKKYIDMIEKVENKSDIERTQQLHEQRFEVYQQFSGHQLEQAEGVDGQTYWRSLLPDGSPTRWHETAHQAISDVFMSTMSIFRPLGEAATYKQQELVVDDQYQLEDYVGEKSDEYSNFELIGMKAFQDLYVHHIKATASGLPGLQFKHLQRQIGADTSTQLLDHTPIDVSVNYVKKFNIDELSTTTPYSLIRARAHAYWKNLMTVGLADPHDLLEQFEPLVQSTPWLKEKIFQVEKNEGTLNNSLERLDPNNERGRSRIKRVQENVAKVLATVSTDYLIATAAKQPLPQSFKTWLSLVPLCPPEQSVHLPQTVHLGPKRRNLLRWSNRHLSTQLQNKTDLLMQYRQQQEQMEASPIMPRLMSALGLNREENVERAWSHYYGGQRSTLSQHEELWNLLVQPSAIWKRTEKSKKYWIYNKLASSYGILEDREQIYGSPRQFQSALYNLDAVLKEYPQLHHISLAPNSNERFISLDLIDASQVGNSLEQPEFSPLGWQLPSETSDGYHYGGEVPAPEPLYHDARVLPSMMLLHDLRLFNSRLAIHNEQGIWWEGKLYGMGHELLPGLNKRWKPQRPLASLIPVIDDIQQRIEHSHGDPLNFMGISFSPLTETLDMSSLEHATLYRYKYFPSHTIRLMPGYSQHSDPVMRSPHVVQARSAVYFDRRRHIADPQQGGDIYTNLNYYDTLPIYQHNDKTHDVSSRATVDYILHRLYDEIDTPSFEEQVERGEVQVEDLLVTLYEDTGLGYEMTRKTLDDLTPGRLALLNICYNLAQIQYSGQRIKPYENLKDILHRIRSKENGVERLTLDILDMVKRHNNESKARRQKAVEKGFIKEDRTRSDDATNY